MRPALLVANLITSGVFITLFLAGCIIGRRAKQTLRRLTIAIRLYAVAIAAQVANLGIDLIHLPDEPLDVVLSTVTLAAAIPTLIFTRRRRAILGDEVVAEATRTVREWTPR